MDLDGSGGDDVDDPALDGGSRSRIGWFARNGLVIGGVVAVLVGHVYATYAVDAPVGGPGLVLISLWLFAMSVPLVGVGLAIPGRAPLPGVPELELAPSRRRYLLTGALLVALGHPLWSVITGPIVGFVTAGFTLHTFVGVPLLLYGLWPWIADRSARLGDYGATASDGAHRVEARFVEPFSTLGRAPFQWFLGLAGVALVGVGGLGFLALLTGSLAGSAGSGAALGLLAALFAVSFMWGFGCLGLAIVSVAAGYSADGRTDVSSRLVVLGSLLAIVGPVLGLLPVIPLMVFPTAMGLSLVGVEVSIFGIAWWVYDGIW